MIPAFGFLEALASFLSDRESDSFHLYSGYRGGSGALLIKTRKQGHRIVFKPWERSRPLGLTDLMKSIDRLSPFRGQYADCHIHIALEFKSNAIRFATTSRGVTLISIHAKDRSIQIVGSANLPPPLLEALLHFVEAEKIAASYDYVGTLKHKGYRKGEAQASRGEARPRNPVVFFSYSWDSESHKRWVLRLAATLIRNGVKILIDEWDLPKFQNDLYFFMERGIAQADHVIMVCTLNYASRANARRGGVGVESAIITGEFYEKAKPNKFIPIIRKERGRLLRCLPRYLKSRYAIDFSKDAEYGEKFEELLRKILRRPKYKRPNLGPMPQLRSDDI